MGNLNTHRATAPTTPKKTSGQLSAFTPNTSANSAKQGVFNSKNEMSPNTEMKELTGALNSTTLNTTVNPQSKQKHQ